jgi:SseB protein N-terminal domain
MSPQEMPEDDQASARLEEIIAEGGEGEDRVQKVRDALSASSVVALGQPAGDPLATEGTESDLLHFTIEKSGVDKVMLPVFTRRELADEALRRNPDWQSLTYLQMPGGRLLENVDPDVSVVINPWTRVEFILPAAES